MAIEAATKATHNIALGWARLRPAWANLPIFFAKHAACATVWPRVRATRAQIWYPAFARTLLLTVAQAGRAELRFGICP